MKNLPYARFLNIVSVELIELIWLIKSSQINFNTYIVLHIISVKLIDQ